MTFAQQTIKLSEREALCVTAEKIRVPYMPMSYGTLIFVAYNKNVHSISKMQTGFQLNVTKTKNKTATVARVVCAGSFQCIRIVIITAILASSTKFESTNA